jgi:oxygen-independent coproporphyrinogen-3 oxidase
MKVSVTAEREPQDLSLAVAASNVPRYTSYPPANHFQPGAGAKLEKPFLSAIEHSEQSSLYIHIPYCDRLCWFCGCHTKQTLSYEPIRSYIRTLIEELRLLRERLASKPRLTRVHLGGGSPSLLRPEELCLLRKAIDETFVLSSDCEVSIEIDPSDVVQRTIPALVEFGMNRASIGVQDFDPKVQQAINRIQSYDATRKVADALRQNGVSAINIDILYGLPHQDTAKLLSTVEQVLSLHPQRVALFGYAHVPWVKPHQRLIPEAVLPGGRERILQARAAAEAIVAAGYLQIGIDHFALPTDGLTIAAGAGKLRRNFQGYTDDQSETLIGLGASSISRFPGGYLQNQVATGRYAALIKDGTLAHDRGFALSDEDRLRSWVIERLMCDFVFRRDDLVKGFGPAALRLWHEACALAHGELATIVSAECGIFSVLEGHRHLARHVASRFDAYLTSSAFRYSKAV